MLIRRTKCTNTGLEGRHGRSGAAATGRRTKSEELGYGDNEFIPWQIGPVL